MKKTKKIFYKDWPDGSRMKLSFVGTGGPIIAEDIVEDSEYKKEIEENEKLFYLKQFDSNILNLLQKRGFKSIEL